MKRIPFSILFLLIPILVGFTHDSPIRYEFSGATAEENKVSLQGAGFGAYPKASVSFGYLPTDNAFDGATDGQGAIVTAKPGEGVMIFGQKISTTNAALVRCSIRTDQSTASVIVATIGNKPDVFVSQNTPTNEEYFTGHYLRLQTVCSPPSTGFQPVIQIINTGNTDSLTAYIDNFEVYFIDPAKYYSGTFLDGDETYPQTDKISIPSDAEAGAVSLSRYDISINLGQIVTNVFMEMRLIPAGTFMMGSTSTEKDRGSNEGPQHEVKITQSFYMGKYEITQTQWQAVMGSNPSSFKGNNLPVDHVSWDDCQTFIQKLNQMGQGTFRLPTEAEWEYACRSGMQTRFYWGDDLNDDQIKYFAWYDGNSGNKTHEVGTNSPNLFGLYDMSGNVCEWCQDWYGIYSSDTQIDPAGAVSGQDRVFRGGNWYGNARYCRSANRDGLTPNLRVNIIGFRVCRNQ